MMPSTRQRQEVYRGYIPALLLITVLGACFRFYALNGRSMWLDEAWLVACSKLPWGDVAQGKILGGQWLFCLILKSIGHVWGYSETSMRFLSALAGSLLIPLSYSLARKVLDTTSSLLVAGLVAICPIAVVYSQESAGYSLWMLLVAGYLRCFLDYLDTESRTTLCLFFLEALLATYIHSFNVFIIAALVLYLWLAPGLKGGRRVLFVLTFLLALLSAPRIMADLRIGQAMSLFHGRVGNTPGMSLDKLYQAFKAIVFAWMQGPSDSIYTPQSFALMRTHERLVTGLLLGIFLFSILRAIISRKQNVLLLAAIVVVHSCAIVFFSVKSNYAPERYSLPLIPVYFILLVRSFCSEEWRTIIPRALGASLICAITINLAGVLCRNYDRPLPWKPDWRGLCESIRAEVGKSKRAQFAIFVPVNVETSLVQFYLPELSQQILTNNRYYTYLYEPEYLWSTPEEIERFHREILAQVKESSIDVLYVPTQRGGAQMNYIKNYLRGGFILQEPRSTVAPWLYVFERRVPRRRVMG